MRYTWNSENTNALSRWAVSDRRRSSLSPSPLGGEGRGEGYRRINTSRCPLTLSPGGERGLLLATRFTWPAFMRCFVSFALLALLAAGCNKPTAAQTGQGKGAGGSPPQVTTVKPQRKTIRLTADRPGHIEAFEETRLYAKISGYVIEPKVDIEDTVKKGQLLAELSARHRPDGQISAARESDHVPDRPEEGDLRLRLQAGPRRLYVDAPRRRLGPHLPRGGEEDPAKSCVHGGGDVFRFLLVVRRDGPERDVVVGYHEGPGADRHLQGTHG